MNQICLSMEEVWKCLFHAKNMRGKHNPGLLMNRTEDEIFYDALEGKLGETGFSALLKQVDSSIESGPNYEVYDRGVWDLYDFKINNKIISIKTIASYAQLLLLDTVHYDRLGQLLPIKGKAQIKTNYHVLMKVYLKNGSHFINKKEFYKAGLRPSTSRDYLEDFIYPNYTFIAQFCGWITPYQAAKNQVLFKKKTKLRAAKLYCYDIFHQISCPFPSPEKSISDDVFKKSKDVYLQQDNYAVYEGYLNHSLEQLLNDIYHNQSR